MRGRKVRASEFRLGLAEYDTQGRSIEDARGLFLTALIKLEPRALQSLRASPLRAYRQLFGREAQPSLTQQQASQIARQIGFEDGAIDEDEARAEMGDEYELAVRDKAPGLTYPDIYWRDPAPNLEHAKKLREDRIARRMSVRKEASRLKILPSELEEMERGCKPNAGLTTTTGAEPLRRKLRQWGKRWNIAEDWCFDWALEQLRTWPPKHCPPYSLDRRIGLVIIPIQPPSLPPYQPQLLTRKSYIETAHKLLGDYCNEVERLMDAAGLKRSPAKRDRGGSHYEHFYWLAGYQCLGWSQNRVATATGVDRAAVNRAINKTAKEIGLTLRRKAMPSPPIDSIRAALKACSKR